MCRHENEISSTTDVASRPEFAVAPHHEDDRRHRRPPAGSPRTSRSPRSGRSARASACRSCAGRPSTGASASPRSTSCSHSSPPPTPGPSGAGGRSASTPRPSTPRTSRASASPSSRRSLEALRRHGLDRADAPVFIQSFEVSNLRRLASLTRVPLIQLIEPAGRPWDFTARPLRPHLCRPAAARGPARDRDLRPRHRRRTRAWSCPATAATACSRPRRSCATPTPRACSSTSSRCAPRTSSCPPSCAAARTCGAAGDLAAEAELFLKAGVDGFFTDQPGLGVKARDAFLRR